MPRKSGAVKGFAIIASLAPGKSLASSVTAGMAMHASPSQLGTLKTMFLYCFIKNGQRQNVNIYSTIKNGLFQGLRQGFSRTKEDRTGVQPCKDTRTQRGI